MNEVQDTLKRIFEEVQSAARVGPEDLCVIGGRFEAERLSTFVELWARTLGQRMPWRIYEYVSKLLVEQSNTGIPAEDLQSLERARCFGGLADLDLRRDLSTIYWRFIGDPSISLPNLNAESFEANDYWTRRGNILLRRFEKSTLQWRSDDDRVGGQWVMYGDLVLEDEKNKLKVFLKQIHYVRNGRLELVRFTDFETEKR